MAAQTMSAETRELVRQEMESGRDEVNPVLLFQSTSTTLLLAMADGQLDALDLVPRELASRGLDANGKWVGFEMARESHGVTKGNDPVADSVAEALARRHLRIETLRSRYSDSLDFHEVSIWGIRDALVAAYKEGTNSTCEPEAK